MDLKKKWILLLGVVGYLGIAISLALSYISMILLSFKSEEGKGHKSVFYEADF